MSAVRGIELIGGPARPSTLVVRVLDELPLMRRVCAWCHADLGAVVCEPAQAGKISHGICEPCKVRELAALNVSPSPAVPASAAPREETGPAAPEGHPETTSSPARSTATARPGEAFNPSRPDQFWTVTGRDFGRAIAWARRQPNVLADAIRRKLGGSS